MIHICSESSVCSESTNQRGMNPACSSSPDSTGRTNSSNPINTSNSQNIDLTNEFRVKSNHPLGKTVGGNEATDQKRKMMERQPRGQASPQRPCAPMINLDLIGQREQTANFNSGYD